MRILIILLFTTIALTLSCENAIKYSLNRPESVIWNPITKTYLVSNIGTGEILSLSNKTNYTLFSQGKLKGPKGMAIMGNNLYVADVDRLIGLDLKTGKITFELNIPGAKFLNDVAASDSIVYISDTDMDWIVMVNPQNNTIEKFSSKSLSKPNGLYFDHKNDGDYLYVCSQGHNAPLQVLDLQTRTFQDMPNAEVSMADGFTRVNDGSWLVSSWGDSTIYHFNPDFTNVTRIEGKYQSPADIFYCLENEELAIPQLQVNHVIFLIKLVDLPVPEE